MSILKCRQVKAAALATVLSGPIAGFEAVSKAQVINPGDVVVEQVGGSATANGSAALSSAGTAVFLDVYTPTVNANGAVTLSLDTTGGSGVIALPTTSGGSGLAANPLTASGSATSEGLISISADGSSVLVTGYDANASTAGVSSSTTILREVGLVSTATGAIDTSTTTSAFGGNNIRSAALGSGTTTLFAAGAVTPGITALTVDSNSAGTQVGTFSTLNTNAVTTTLVNFRQLEINNGNLYVSDSSGNQFRLSSITGFNGTANSASITELPGTVANNSGSTTQANVSAPYAFAFANNGTTLYVADQGSNGTNSTVINGGIFKYLLSNGTYVADGSIQFSNSVTGITVDSLTGSNGSFNAIFATTPAGIYEASDTSGNGVLAGTATVLVTAGTYTAFRGDAVEPASVTSTPEPTSLVLTTFAAAAALTRRRRNAVHLS